MWRRSVSRLATRGEPWYPHTCVPRLCAYTRSSSSAFTQRKYTSTSPEEDVFYVNPNVVGWKSPTDWTTFQYPEKITTLANQLLKMEEDERYLVTKLLQIQWDLPDSVLDAPRQVYAAQQQAANAPAAAAGPPPAPPKPEKTTFKLVLTALTDDAKIKVLKEVRVLKPGMKLLESKALVDKLPSVLKEEMPKEEAELWQKKLQEAGATTELQ